MAKEATRKCAICYRRFYGSGSFCPEDAKAVAVAVDKDVTTLTDEERLWLGLAFEDDWRVVDEFGREVWAKADLAKRYRKETRPRGVGKKESFMQTLSKRSIV